MWLLVDDKRELNCDVTARTYEAGKLLLDTCPWECLCIDHDLGTELNGYNLIVWALANDKLPNKVQIVTSNPVGADNIRAALKNAGYDGVDRINYERCNTKTECSTTICTCTVCVALKQKYTK